jgi:cell division septal protein FtsQ
MKRRPERDPEEDDDDRPRKKARRREDDENEEPSGWERYQRSTARYVFLGVLVVLMLVLAFFLWQKYQRDKDAREPTNVSTRGTA